MNEWPTEIQTSDEAQKLDFAVGYSQEMYVEIGGIILRHGWGRVLS